jgi:type IV secretory pathway TrbF-like protein
MQRPIEVIELIKILVNAAVVWVVVMGFWPMDAMQQAATLTFFLAVVNVAGALWQKNQVTPLVDPKDKTGEPLVRAVDGQPSRAARIYQARKEQMR